MKKRKHPAVIIFERALAQATKVTHYFRTDRGDVTVCAITHEQMPDSETPVFWFVGVSLCSPKEQFCRKEGRNWAAARALMGGAISLHCNRKNLNDELEAIALAENSVTFREVGGEKVLPSWFRKFRSYYKTKRMEYIASQALISAE